MLNKSYLIPRILSWIPKRNWNLACNRSFSRYKKLRETLFTFRRFFLLQVGELVKVSGGQMDDELKAKFEDITRTILSNQTEALANLTLKVEKEIGQVWRQMGIVYGQVSNSISILEKVKTQTEGYVNNTGRNLGEMEGTVEGLSERMVDVDSNLNYMLGQLSLVVQEFNQVKL